jgi:hypothetical protein
MKHVRGTPPGQAREQQVQANMDEVRLVDRLTLPAINTAIKLNHKGTIAAITNQEFPLTVTSLNGRKGEITLTEEDISALVPYPVSVVNGGTGADLSATGGANKVVMQTSAGGAFSVAQLAASNLSNGTTGTGSVVLAASPTVTGTLTAATVAATSITGGAGAMTGTWNFQGTVPTLIGPLSTILYLTAHLGAYADAASRVFSTTICLPIYSETASLSLSAGTASSTNCTYSASGLSATAFLFQITSSAAGACSATVEYQVTITHP